MKNRRSEKKPAIPMPSRTIKDGSETVVVLMCLRGALTGGKLRK
jgi:hypothetical protein